MHHRSNALAAYLGEVLMHASSSASGKRMKEKSMGEKVRAWLVVGYPAYKALIHIYGMCPRDISIYRLSSVKPFCGDQICLAAVLFLCR